MNNSRLKVMLVDDDEEDYMLTRNVLSNSDLSMLDLNWVGSYEHALTAMPKNEHDVYLVDVRLGEGDGIELVRQTAEQGCKGPFIVLSGCMGKQVDSAALSAGAADYLTKDSLSPALLERSIRYAIDYSRALSDRKQLEGQLRQAQKMEAVGRLAGGVAHEFNNMLQVITAYTTYSLECLAPEEQLHRDLQEVLRASENASRLAGDLLAFGRQRPMRCARISLNELIAELLTMLRPVIGRAIEIRFEPDPRVTTIDADAEMVQQMLLNLCINARDAMPCGGELSIETRGVQLNRRFCKRHGRGQPGRYVMIRVSDTGSGIPSEQMDRVFEPFFTTKEPGKGTGLGLATVRANVEQHGGFVEVESDVGSGTAFRIFLPDAAPAAVQSQIGESGTVAEALRRNARFHLPHFGPSDGPEASEN